MKRLFRLYLLPALLLAGPAGAQSLAGVWQGVEDEQDKSRYCPSVLRVQQRAGTDLFGVLYQEDGNQPTATVTFQMEGMATPAGLRLVHGRKLNETGRSLLRYWCEGAIIFTYDATQEKLTGHADYAHYGKCDTGEFTLYRVKLKSAATVPAGALTTLRVSGRAVRWYADADLKQLVASGNTYPARLRKTTTFYLKQGYFATAESPVVPITIRGEQSGARAAASPAAPPNPRPPRYLAPGAWRGRARRACARPSAGGAAHGTVSGGHRRAAARRPAGARPAGRGAQSPAGPAPARGRAHRPGGRVNQKPAALRAARRGSESLPGAGRRGRRAPQPRWLRRRAPALPRARRPQPARRSAGNALAPPRQPWRRPAV